MCWAKKSFICSVYDIRLFFLLWDGTHYATQGRDGLQPVDIIGYMYQDGIYTDYIYIYGLAYIYTH